jgi:hypothetical protein
MGHVSKKALKVSIEIQQQLLDRNKTIVLFLGTVMDVIAFTVLIVVTDDAAPALAALEPVLQSMGAVLAALR